MIGLFTRPKVEAGLKLRLLMLKSAASAFLRRWNVPNCQFAMAGVVFPSACSYMDGDL